MKNFKLTQSQLFNMATCEVPIAVLTHPGMIGEAERRALFGLAREYYVKNQVIVDAGAFLGASTKAFLLAMDSIGQKNHAIDTYEFGVINQYNATWASEALNQKFTNGTEFGYILQDLVGDQKGIVKYHLGDIRKYQHSQKNICIAFLDILKDPPLMVEVYGMLFPSFKEGTIVYQQDYFHAFHPWIAYSMAKYSHAFTYCGRPDADEDAFNAAVFQVVDASCLPTQGIDDKRITTKEEVLDWMGVAIAMNDHPYEKLNMIGLRCAAQVIFEKNEHAARKALQACLHDANLAYLLEDSTQEKHFNRIFRFISAHAANNLIWIN